MKIHAMVAATTLTLPAIESSHGNKMSVNKNQSILSYKPHLINIGKEALHRITIYPKQLMTRLRTGSDRFLPALPIKNSKKVSLRTPKKVYVV